MFTRFLPDLSIRVDECLWLTARFEESLVLSLVNADGARERDQARAGKFFAPHRIKKTDGVIP
jgi:hypothetical protein